MSSRLSHPEGDLTRRMGIRKGSLSTAFININRGKQSLSIDLKTSEGRQIIKSWPKNVMFLCRISDQE